jgi:DNA-binding response OmpR family regulator
MQRILIAEDDQFLANICREKFAGEGFNADVEFEQVPRAWDNPPRLPQTAFFKRAGGPIRVLVVDDDKVIQGVLGFFMEQAGYVVQPVFSGPRALEMVEEFAPDIMVLDGMMPDLDGFEVLKIWQRHPRLAGIPVIPVIMLSAAKEEIKNARTLGTGAVDYLTKPFSPDNLVALVNQYVEPNARNT